MVSIPRPHKHVASALSGFTDFLKKQNVLGLAIGLVLGSASKGVVDALVADILNPLLGVLLGGADLGHKSFCLNIVQDVCKNQLAWGHFLTVIIQFVIVAAVVYFVVNKVVSLFAPEEKK